ncbi:carboxylate--amine ligase [Vagococcus hydrophili]|uniref:Carboxylate--amine ligase n=1 Tax=Vagococcus hydrophili TaxID=2714947 RepID=A0A6G8ART8_9ENTE|nr:carboxylate--amine ligase [Vagococcus hydrophili]QIL47716.1 carboxylate--amine ligase [Vagococcus hydrophili]
MKFLPIILGTDVNAYGIARSIHMAYGIKSLCVGQGKLPMTNHSKIVDIEVVNDLANPSVFSTAMIPLLKNKLEAYDKLILFAASDGYAELVIDNQEELSKYCRLPFVKKELKEQLILKEDFYDLCEKLELPYPKTMKVTKDNYREIEVPFTYPVVVKPSNSVTYALAEFKDKKKAYILNSEEEVTETLFNIFTSGYGDTMLMQDFIPGPDSNMRVLNAYVGSNSKVHSMCLGHPFLEDVTPTLVGNYVAIKSIFDADIYETYTRFLEGISYTGFANFDMKYDERDQTFKIFEINLRPGRSSFYSTLAGCNLIEEAIKDLVEEIKVEEAFLSREEKLWLGVPKEVVLTYTEDDTCKQVAKEMIDRDDYGYTLFYDQDKSIVRNLSMKKYYQSYVERYEKWFKKKGR